MKQNTTMWSPLKKAPAKKKVKTPKPWEPLADFKHPMHEAKMMKQFDWFLFENRARELIKAELNPLNDWFIFINKQISELKEVDLGHQWWLDEFEFILHKTWHRTSGIDEINKKIYEIDQRY